MWVTLAKFSVLRTIPSAEVNLKAFEQLMSKTGRVLNLQCCLIGEWILHGYPIKEAISVISAKQELYPPDIIMKQELTS